MKDKIYQKGRNCSLLLHSLQKVLHTAIVYLMILSFCSCWKRYIVSGGPCSRTGCEALHQGSWRRPLQSALLSSSTHPSQSGCPLQWYPCPRWGSCIIVYCVLLQSRLSCHRSILRCFHFPLWDTIFSFSKLCTFVLFIRLSSFLTVTSIFYKILMFKIKYEIISTISYFIFMFKYPCLTCFFKGRGFYLQ